MELIIKASNENNEVTENHVMFRNTPEDYMKLLSVILMELPEIIEEVYYLLTIIYIKVQVLNHVLRQNLVIHR